MSSLDDFHDVVSPSWFKYDIQQKKQLGNQLFPDWLRPHLAPKYKNPTGLHLDDPRILRSVLRFKSYDYISIPKCSSTSMRLLRRWLWDPDVNNLIELFSPFSFTGDDCYDPWPKEIHSQFERKLIRAGKISKTIPFLRPGYPTVTIVRDPYERCISALCDILTKKLSNLAPDKITSDLLSDFVETVPLWIDPHLWPAHFFVRDVQCQKVPLADTQSLIKEIHDKEYKHKYPYPWLHNSVTNVGRVKQRISFNDLRPAARSIIEKYYAIDFEKGLAGNV